MLASTSTTTGIEVEIASPVAVQRVRRLGAPARGDDRALGNEDARDQLRLLDQPAAVVAQVEHDPARAHVQLVFDGFAHFGVRAGAEGGERDDAELDAVDRPRRRRPRRARRSWRGVIFSVRVTPCFACPCGGASTASATSVPGGPLISATAASASRPSSLRPLTARIRSPACRPGASGRRGVEHAGDAKAPAVRG